VEQQLLIAMGLPLMLSQDDIKMNGHALECRIYAEDPQNNFHPAPGSILNVQWPKESLARTDTWFHDTVEIRSDFDPMLAKVITHASTRLYAIEKMKKALQSTLLMGNTNNIWYLKSILNNSDFKTGRINTDFCEVFKSSSPAPTTVESVVAAILIWQFQTKANATDVWNTVGFFRISNQVKYLINDKSVEVNYQKEDGNLSFSISEGPSYVISNILVTKDNIEFSFKNENLQFNWVITPGNELLLEREVDSWTVISQHQLPKNNAYKKPHISNHNGAAVTAPIPGKIIEVNIQEGQLLKAGDTLMVLEAMKMENSIQMPQDGIVKKILIKQGNQVKANELLVEIKNIEN
ncbi:MAG: biotin/lipoyl-binding protein, partial [Dysgonamonadaceae bacterium]|nr:biotin/lipoyl-binding protein [Dysgonamonadaceae bacterium]